MRIVMHYLLEAQPSIFHVNLLIKVNYQANNFLISAILLLSEIKKGIIRKLLNFK
jgi:hypothetical protein